MYIVFTHSPKPKTNIRHTSDITITLTISSHEQHLHHLLLQPGLPWPCLEWHPTSKHKMCHKNKPNACIEFKVKENLVCIITTVMGAMNPHFILWRKRLHSSWRTKNDTHQLIGLKYTTCMLT